MRWGNGANKYHAKRTRGFASKKEAYWNDTLQIMQMSGMIWDLEVQPKFPLIINGKKVGRYTPDFRYTSAEGTVVVEVKGYKTEAYRLRVKVFLALYPNIIFKEV